MFKKLNFFEKYSLKYQNKEAYKNYKFLKQMQHVAHPSLNLADKDFYTFKHSGNAGDIIYALPSIYALSKGKPIHLYLDIHQKGFYGKNSHPLGDVMLNEKMVEMLKPLLLSQKNIALCEIYSNQNIDYDLDLFRKYPFNLSIGNIAHWYFLIFAVNADLGKPWLLVSPNNSFQNAIVVARSSRYHAPEISYDFLKKYPRVIFVGLKDEYVEMKKMVANIEYQSVNNFLELASIISGSKLFIGNQSFPFALAEALKVNRLLEVYHLSPNVNVEGALGFSFCFQPQFEQNSC